ncbi:DUF1249 domain-containing protein [Ketobacter alkanivorans]|uniref:Cytoplasmic protein n=1 Tax=Ketobacter alkanivorans TaxID=1917421 RepID=A0A2K9LM75_9GAMM|nr:DUF1249 domain-containing protein [Ketobacter alkanivorans]AUM13456.1 hypothetical protein Kalk_13950 [Ketobacter alkanivorans]MCP5019762.1 DUF1249 domain-containing protein [Ketobacter sp.]
MKPKKGYTPNLSKLMSDCEINYHRLMRLLPEIDDLEEWRFGVDANTEQLKQVSIHIVERSKYTTTVAVAQESLLDDWVPKPTLTVRLYHDAQMAEVLTFQRNRYIRQTYAYPNEKMFQPDEKAQLNVFLGEWLEFCLRSGRALLKA